MCSATGSSAQGIDAEAAPRRPRPSPRPLVRRDGEFVEVSWDEAFAEIERRLTPIVERHGRDAVAVYFGNPNAHSLPGCLQPRRW